MSKLEDPPELWSQSVDRGLFVFKLCVKNEQTRDLCTSCWSKRPQMNQHLSNLSLSWLAFFLAICFASLCHTFL